MMASMKKISFFLVLMIFRFYGNSTTWTINNIGNTFSPSTITIAPGDDVNFVLSSIHDAVEVSETTWNQNGTTPLNEGFLLPLGGGSVATTKLTAGTHYFVCTPHANEGMPQSVISYLLWQELIHIPGHYHQGGPVVPLQIPY